MTESQRSACLQCQWVAAHMVCSMQAPLMRTFHYVFQVAIAMSDIHRHYALVTDGYGVFHPDCSRHILADASTDAV